MGSIGSILTTALGWLHGASKDRPKTTVTVAGAVLLEHFLGWSPGTVKSALTSLAETLAAIANVMPS